VGVLGVVLNSELRNGIGIDGRSSFGWKNSLSWVARWNCMALNVWSVLSSVGIDGMRMGTYIRVLYL